MRRLLLVFLFALAAAPVSLFSQQAFFKSVAGAVEIKHAGSEVWEAARAGQALFSNTVISTGFKSAAVIEFGDSLITARPLTRLTLSELIKIDNNEKVDLNIQTGRVRSDVSAPPGGKVEFTIRSSSATTSVRGTSFEVNTLGVVVTKGVVRFAGFTGAPVLVDAGGYSRVDERTGRVVNPKAAALEELSPNLPVASETVRELSQPSEQPELFPIALGFNVYNN